MHTPHDTDRAQQLRRLFDELADLAPSARAERLRQIAEDDAALGQTLERLLAAHDDAGDRLETYRDRVHAYRQTVIGAGTDPADLLGQTVQHYLVLEWLGGGGMGDVYKAWDTRLDRTVALKVLPPHLSRHAQTQQRFMQEARAASVLDHPHICTIYEIGASEAQQLFIVMPCYGGETLAARVARGPLPLDDAVTYAIQMAAGLQRAHAAGIVHRDVKPGNVMITEHGDVKVLDFGIAKIADVDLTRTGARLGTVAYMSPEHARGAPADPRMDVWSLGVVLYEMLTGQRPFTGQHAAAVLLAIQTEDPVPVQQLRPDAPAALVRIVERALAKDPATRYASMETLLTDLRAVAAPGSPTRAPVAAADPATWPHAFVASVLVALMAGIGWWVLPRPAEPSAPAAPHALAVMYFDNLTGDPALDWVEPAMVEMLTANLARYDGVEVLSSQRLFDIMKQIDGTQADRIDRSVATEIARTAGVRTMLLGSVLGDQDHLRLNSQLVDAETGALLGTEVVDVGAEGTLLALADSLTQRLAARLGAGADLDLSGARVAYTLTGSPRALQHYVEGLQALYRARYEDAIARFEAATAADSTFAMAHYHRALAHSWLTGEADRPSLERALRHADRITDRERALIEATFTMLDDLPTRKAAFEQFVARYPDEKYARYQLGEILYHNYWPHAAVEAFEHAAELDPHFLVAYVHPLDFHLHTDDHRAAQALLDRIFALDSANTEFRLSQAYLSYVRRPDARHADTLTALLRQAVAARKANTFSRLDAEATLATLTGTHAPLEGTLRAFREGGHYGDEGYVLATNSLAGLAWLRGDRDAAVRHLREARARAPESPTQLYEEGLFHLAQGETASARALAERIVRLHDDGTAPFPEVATLGWHLLLLAHLADGRLTEAHEALVPLARLQAERRSEYGFLHDDARGRLACRAGQWDEADRAFDAARAALSFPGTHVGPVLPFSKLLLGARLACLEAAGRPEALIERAERIPLFVYHFHDLNTSTVAAWQQTLLRRARAYEATGRSTDAVAMYEAYLAPLGPDAAAPGARQARQRLALLQAAYHP